jgi:hypothetical protein
MDSSNLRRIVKEFAEAAGLGRLSPNELRHSATSLLVDAGTPIHDVSDLLGHSSIRMLAQTYRHKIRSVVDVTEGQSRMLLSWLVSQKHAGDRKIGFSRCHIADYVQQEESYGVTVSGR